MTKEEYYNWNVPKGWAVEVKNAFNIGYKFAQEENKKHILALEHGSREALVMLARQAEEIKQLEMSLENAKQFAESVADKQAEEIKRLRDALKFYASYDSWRNKWPENNWCRICDVDLALIGECRHGGKKAREALNDK